MKKLILVLSIVAFVGCSKEDEGCKCDARYTKEGNGYYIVADTPITCDTRQPINNDQNAFFAGCQ